MITDDPQLYSADFSVGHHEKIVYLFQSNPNIKDYEKIADPDAHCGPFCGKLRPEGRKER
jgi:hypothetical protein